MLYEITEDSNDSELVTLGSPITLSRSVVAVPAYSSLTIQVELWNRATKVLIVQGSYKAETCNEWDHRIITGLNSVNADVIVDWEEPFLLSRLVAKKDEVQWGIHFHFWTPHAVEVFSIFIGRQNDEQLSLYGMVTFDGSRGQKCLFKRDKNDPYVLPPGSNLLPLKGPDDTLIPADTFWMSVELEDVDGRVSIKGFVPLSVQLDKHKKAWFNRLLCGVVKGRHDRSFAAIHYTVLSHALKATLKVHFFFKGKPSSDDFCKIHGSLVALYDKYGCKTPYEKLYYRNVLFERLEDNPLEFPCMNFDVDLWRHVVSVPHNCSLQIEIDLSCQTTSFIERLKETKRFQISPGVCDEVIIEGAEVGININVEWSQA
ncbi:uncharacterized protein LOC110700950 [Chenopodium quinoa]|uniref:uncharacterized protein LOC110700950 n=1 Tax=Chenopodium quinoa TaxID=63459 RepID=UPI000B784E9D|nr:uncharacterized protein LOC110700950 [Chenopodium quinoa]